MKKTAAALWAGVLAAGILAGCSAGTSTNTQSPSTSAPESTYEYTFRDLPQPKYWASAEQFAGGSGTQEDPYQISQPSQLALLEELIREGEDTSYQSAYYVLTADIALNDVTDVEQWREQGPEYSWRPITGGQFHLDGAGHTVRGMYINTNNETSGITQGSYGLLGSLWGGSVTDLTVEQSYVCVSGNAGQVGGIVGSLGGEARMEGCVSRVTIDVYDGTVGGVVGLVNGGRSATEEYDTEEERGSFAVVEACSFQGTITQVKEQSLSHIGGVAGSSSGDLVKCVSQGTIRFGALDVDTVGGVVAAASGVVSQCRHTGTLDCQMDPNTKAADILVNVGGIAGRATLSNVGSEAYMDRVCTLTDCENAGQVSGAWITGGIAGLVRNDRNDWCVKVLNCVNTGAVTSLTSQDVGGVIGKVENHGDPVHGDNIVVEGCRNEADLTQGQVGGVIGSLVVFAGNTRISGCTNSGNLSTSGEGLTCGGIVANWMLGLWEDDDTAQVTIQGCKNTGAVDAPASAGGIVGSAQCATPKAGNRESLLVMQDCENTALVTVHTDNGYLGGIAGSWGMEFTPSRVENCRNTGDLVMKNKDLTQEEVEEISFTLSRMCGGILGRVGGDYLSTADDANDPQNINRKDAWLQVKDCTSTGGLDVNNIKEYPNEKGEVRYRNYFGGIIGNSCAEEGFSIQVVDCNYSGFERGLGNDDLPDVGAKI